MEAPLMKFPPPPSLVNLAIGGVWEGPWRYLRNSWHAWQFNCERTPQIIHVIACYCDIANPFYLDERLHDSRSFSSEYTVSHPIVHREVYRLNVLREPAQAVDSCRTVPPDGRYIYPKHFTKYGEWWDGKRCKRNWGFMWSWNYEEDRLVVKQCLIFQASPLAPPRRSTSAASSSRSWTWTPSRSRRFDSRTAQRSRLIAINNWLLILINSFR